MKAIQLVPASVLAMAVGLSAMAVSAKDDTRKETIEVANVQGGPATVQPGTSTQYNPKEVGVDKIQSPRDPATGQATGNSQQAAGPSQGQPGTQGIKLTDILVSSATAPNNPANETAQSAGITSPRDSTSGQATGERRQGPGTGQSQDKLGNFEIQDVRSGTAQTGTTAMGNSQQDPAAAGQPAGFSWGLAQTGYGVKESAQPGAPNANAGKSKPPRQTSGARKKRKPRS